MNTEKNTARSSYTRWQRLIASMVTFFFSMQLCMPAMAGVAGVIESALIEAELNANYLFQREDNNEYQFKSADYLDTNAHQTDVNIESFFKRLKESSKENLPAPLMIPIGVGDITVILPHYPLIKRVGTNFVQSRYIRSQVYAQLGRNLIDTQVYGTEREQISKLYDNAYNYALVSGKIFGEFLGLSASQITTDMIWPEVRFINGENVLVPILYLKSSTIDAQKVTGDENEFGGSLVELGGLQIDNTDVTFRRAAFLKIAENLVNNQGNLIAEDDLKIVAGGSLQNISGLISSGGDLIIGAHSIENRTIVHRYNLGKFQSERFGPIAEINAEGDIYFKTSSDIILQGSVVSAGESIRFDAGGDIYIGSQQITNQRDGSSGRISYRSSSIAHLASKLSASDTIALIAQGNILIDASEIVSDSGHIEILAGLGITIEDNLDVRESYRKGKYGKRKIEESVYQTVAIRSLLDAGKGVRLHTEYGDITLKATDITSTEGTRVSAKNGAVNLLMTTETDHYSYSSVKKGLFTTTTEQRGHYIETGVQNTIVGGFAVEALNGLTVEYEGDPNLTLDEQIQVLSQFDGLEWMAEVRQNFPNADWQAVDLAYEEWNESSTTLSAAAMAVITIIVAVCTYGAGAGMIGAASGTTQAAMANAAFTTMVNTTTMATANATVNGGSIDDILKAGFEAVHSEEGLKSIATSVVTAGALSALDTQFFNAKDLVTEGSTLAEMQTVLINGVESSVPVLSLTGQALQTVIHATVSAGIQTTFNGGSFEEQFISSLATDAINNIGESLTENIIGSDLSTAVKYIARASTGCLTGALSSELNDADAESACLTSAGGSIVEQLVSEAFDPQVDPLEAKQQELADWLEKNISGEITLLDDIDLQDYLSSGNIGPDAVFYISEFSKVRSELTQLTLLSTNISRLTAALGAFVVGAGGSDISITDRNVSLQGWADFNHSSKEIKNALILHEVLSQQQSLNTLLSNRYPASTAVDLGLLDEGLVNNPEFDLISGEQLLFLTALEDFKHLYGEEVGYVEGQFVGSINFHNLRKIAFIEGVDAALEVFEDELNYAIDTHNIANHEELRWYLEYYQTQFEEIKEVTDVLEYFGFGLIGKGLTTSARAVGEMSASINGMLDAFFHFAKSRKIQKLLDGAEYLDEAAKSTLRNDLFNNDELFEALREKPELLKSWKVLNELGDEVPALLRADAGFVKQFDDFVNYQSYANDHIFSGHIKVKGINEAGENIYQVTGIHSALAFSDTVRISPGAVITDLGNGYYMAKVQVKIEGLTTNDGWKVKPNPSTFFPDSWSKERIQAEITLANYYKVHVSDRSDGTSFYKGMMSDGTMLAIYIKGGIIQSAYPSFSK
ncbi:DUF637 domain-containing protein [Microbulbifer sp. JMSA008]|uniref:DUF637 domain-containing protein n=1 Tax=Microbulbifer sp. JMSA008 TaxID=3243373 RepID=UPI004039CF4A